MAWSAVASLRKASAITTGSEKLALICATDWLTSSIIRPSSTGTFVESNDTEGKIGTTTTGRENYYEELWHALNTISKSSSPTVQVTFSTTVMRIAQETYRRWNEQSLRYAGKRYHYYHDLVKSTDTRTNCTHFTLLYYPRIIEILLTYMIAHTETQIRIAAVECFEYLITGILLLPVSENFQPILLMKQIFHVLFRTAVNVQIARNDENSSILPSPGNPYFSIDYLSVPTDDDGSLNSQFHEAALLGIRAFLYGILNSIEQLENNNCTPNTDSTTALSISDIYDILYDIMEYCLYSSAASNENTNNSSTSVSTGKSILSTVTNISFSTYLDRYSKLSTVDAIREATFHCTESILQVLYELSKANSFIQIPDKRNRITSFINNSLLVVGQGMDDCNIRVRFAACTCVRTLVNKFPQYIQQYFLIFLPRLCFTRYFGPDRQRMYCVDTWRQLVMYLEQQRQTIPTSTTAVNDNDSMIGRNNDAKLFKEEEIKNSMKTTTVSTIIGHRSISPIAGQTTKETDSITERIFAEETDQETVPSIVMNRSVSPSRSSSPIQRVIDRVITPPRSFPSASNSSNDVKVNSSTTNSSSNSPPFSLSRATNRSPTVTPSTSSPGLSIAAVAALAPGAERNSAIGPQLVARYIEPIVMYYRSALSVNYPSIQEAACHCIAELATKIDPTAVAPYAEPLIESLLTIYSSSLKDVCSNTANYNNSIDVNPSSASFSSLEWNVRDAAIIAFGKMYVSHTEGNVSVQNLLPKILILLFQSLYDPIRAIREHTAMIFGLYTASLLSTTTDESMEENSGATTTSSTSLSLTTSSSVQTSVSSLSSPSEKMEALSARLKTRSSLSSTHAEENSKTSSSSSPFSSIPSNSLIIQLNKVYYYVITSGLKGTLPDKGKIVDLLEPFFALQNIRIPPETKETLLTLYYNQSTVNYVPSRASIMEGSLYLFREYCACAPDQAATLLDILADSAADTQATAPNVQEVIWRILPVCAVSLGTKRIKRYLDVLIVPLGNCLLSNVSITSSSSSSPGPGYTMNTNDQISSSSTGMVPNMGSTVGSLPLVGNPTNYSTTTVVPPPSLSTTGNNGTPSTTSSIQADNRSRIWSATDCIRQLANLVGVSIFRARLSTAFSPAQVNSIQNYLGRSE